jgi:hypothetical protein
VARLLAFILLVHAAAASALVFPDAVRVRPCAEDMPVGPLALTFAPRDAAGLAAFLANQQDPRSPEYRHWLAPEEFGARFGVDADAYEEAARWLVLQGFREVRLHPGRLAISFNASAGRVGRAFGVEMAEYRSQGVTRAAPAGQPTLPAFRGVVPTALLGLDAFARVRPHGRLNGTNFLAPLDVATVFGLDVVHAAGVTGTGVRIAVVAVSDFDVGAVAAFRRAFALPPGLVEKRFTASSPGTTDAEFESLIDTEWSGATAPGATVLAEIAPSDEVLAVADALMDVVDGRLAEVVSLSLGACEGVLGQSTSGFFDTLFQQAAAQGQSVLVASGDTGVTGCGAGLREPVVDGLASSPWVTGVGGTVLDPLFDPDGKATGYGGEVAWNEGGGATGGGLSKIFLRPSYQLGLVLPGNTRGVPDVAFPASRDKPGFALVNDALGRGTLVGGTSVGAPIWAGMAALLVQERGRVGLLNPELYRLGAAQAAGGAPVFHDVTTGNNGFAGVHGYDAGPGFDLATGWGSFDAPALLGSFAAGCTSDLACDDGDSCSLDRCTAGVCHSDTVPDGTACEPDPCLAGTCRSGACGTMSGARGDRAVGCVLGNRRFVDLVCSGSAIPASITRRLHRSQVLLERTGGASTGKAHRLVRQAGRLLAGAAHTLARNRRFARTQCGLAVADRLAYAAGQFNRLKAAG